MKRSTTGFTIIELLIAIVVIAIIAAVSTVAYSGMQKRASQLAIHTEFVQWKKLFDLYKAANGSYPLPTAGDPATSGGPGTSALNRYCLGTGFPQSNGTSYCHVVNSGSPWRVDESTGTYLLNQLSTLGTPPASSRKYVYGNTTGPVFVYENATTVYLLSIFPGGTSCGTYGMWAGYGDSSRQDCLFTLSYP